MFFLGAFTFLQAEESNKHFVMEKSLHPNQTMDRIKERSQGQHPFAIVVSCSDSRVPPSWFSTKESEDLKNAGLLRQLSMMSILSPALTELINKINPSVHKDKGMQGDLWDNAVRQNIRQSMKD